MSGAYRDGPAAPRAPLREVLWRRRVGRAATLLFGLAVADLPVIVLSDPAHWNAWAAVRLAFSVAIASAVWMLTSPRPGARGSRLGWLLRAAATALPLADLAGFLTYLWTPLAVCTFVLQIAGMAYLARLFDDGEDPASARQARLLAVASAAAPFILLWLHRVPTLAGWVGVAFLGCMAWAGVLLLSLREMLYVAEGRWWFDNGTDAAGAWVSLLGYVDGHAEVTHADGQRMRFTSRADGEQWLEQHGYLPARRAIEEGLVSEAPAGVLKARVRKKSRAASTSPEPRVRVASDVSVGSDDEAGDELDDSTALEEPEPARAVTVREPHDPRA